MRSRRAAGLRQELHRAESLAGLGRGKRCAPGRPEAPSGVVRDPIAPQVAARERPQLQRRAVVRGPERGHPPLPAPLYRRPSQVLVDRGVGGRSVARQPAVVPAAHRPDVGADHQVQAVAMPQDERRRGPEPVAEVDRTSAAITQKPLVHGCLLGGLSSSSICGPTGARRRIG